MAAVINNQPTMSENYIKSKNFMDALNELLWVIESIPDLKDGDYLKACDALKKLNDNKNHMVERIRETVIVAEAIERVRQARPARVRVDDDVRIAQGIAERCSKCQRVVAKLEGKPDGVCRNIIEHKQRQICHDIFSAKRLAIKLGTADLAPYQDIINAIRSWAIRVGNDKYH